MKLTELLTVLPFYETDKPINDADIMNIEDDSRFVSKDCLFVCMNGTTFNGHDFIEEAVARGAVAVLAEQAVELKLSVPIIYVEDTPKAIAMVASKFYNYPSKRVAIVGITGTNGKTTVAHLLDAICTEAGMKTGVVGTLELKIGKESYPIDNTTPNALFLQKSFHTMVNNGVDIVIMEVSSHALDMGRVYGITFTAAVFTNLSQDHLDYHKTMDHYAHAKSLLFAQLGNEYGMGTPRFAILNKDDAAFSFMNKSTSQPVLTYSRKQPSHLWASDINLTSAGTTFNLHSTSGVTSIRSCLIGPFNVSNMLAAAGAAYVLGISLATIQQSLGNISGVSGRFEQVAAQQPYSVIVDYAHTPDSLENVLQTLKQLAKGRIIVIIGCGGDRDRKKRPMMAQTALVYADWCFFTSDNPRTENPRAIIDDMTSQLVEQEQDYTIIPDRKQAIKKAIDMAAPEDIVLIAGKGHEMHQEVGNIKYPFDDRKVAREAMYNKET